ncbi:hypothetical protein N7468_005494 [Penicillium chermesinum]|uniref:Peptidase M20 domain-containing protein 2 n=1 Tax=Penicillium chermesinum TaxID=63820 RepID=A0A9W9TNG1_9EURO|nr:uncharacterized protein N7468_005494 [Penicillium chermesinum]KAJ5232538.1 hypothetical protein N7468_005494 [Penicillium chermesinum]
MENLHKVADDCVANSDADLRKINLDIHSHPETLYQEVYAHELLCDYFDKQGFTVERGAGGLPTAFRASFGPETGAGGQLTRAVAINLEYDALPILGHACGHNLIATAGVAAALGMAAAIKEGNLSGRVVAIGTPAEEGGGGKIKLIKAGIYKDIFCCLMVHAIMCGSELTIEYIGKPAHAMAAPWDGINALDAMTLLHTSIGLLRQQIMPTDRIRGVVLSAGESSGVIPHYSKARYCVRSASLVRYRTLKTKFINCLEAAALATGCELKTDWMPAYWDIRVNHGLAGKYVEHMEEIGVPFPPMHEQKANMTCASTDMGNVTYEVPSIHPIFAVGILRHGSYSQDLLTTQQLDSPNGSIHTKAFEQVAATQDSHERAIKCGRAMARTGIEVLVNDDFAAQVKREYDETDMSIALDPWVA